MTTASLTPVLSNVLLAGGLALLTTALTRPWRNPHLAHALWLLVLIKLVTPPFVEIPVLELPRDVDGVNFTEQSGSFSSGFHASLENSSPVEKSGLASSLPSPYPSPGGRSRLTTRETQAFNFSWSSLLLIGWLLGTTVFIGVSLRLHSRFLRVVDESHLAGVTLVEDAMGLAEKMGLSSFPQLRTTTAHVAPLVTGGWRQRVILLPQRLLAQLSRDQTRAVLAHELAHVRRRDHLVQLLKFSVLALYWWNPLAWWASRRLDQSQEACCDAWVAWALPDHRRTYSQTLLQTVEFLTEHQAMPAVAGTFMGRCVLERRIEMILNQTVPRRISRRATGFILAIGLAVLPIVFTAATAAQPAAPELAPGTPTDPQGPEAEALSKEQPEGPAAATADLPYVIEFEQGATRFLAGDEITIREVRGTAETFEPGNIYRITGTYKLASHDKASVAAYTTATNASRGKSRSLEVQTMSAVRGEGDFSLFLPMSYAGWPHVSFYPHGGGEGFGGVYFGTGEYVLKKWWRDHGEKPHTIVQAITLDQLMWSDGPEFLHRMGDRIVESLKEQLYVVARFEGYKGDWEALKQHQAASSSIFQLEAEGSPTLEAQMRSGGITQGRREAWVLLGVKGQPRAGVVYTLRTSDPNWVVQDHVPAR